MQQENKEKDQVGKNYDKKQPKEVVGQRNEESSSDTDKASSSLLFNTLTGGIDLSRIHELPRSFYKGYTSLDEFLSATSASDNQNTVKNNKDGENNVNDNTLGKRQRKHHQKTSEKLDTKNENPYNPSQCISTSAKMLRAKRRAEQDVIEKMNRQYDHNVCLDRFINEMEEMQNNKQETVKKTQNSTDRNESPPSSSGSSDSSHVPHSNEDTDSGSRLSESIKSSTPENMKPNYDVNSNSSKEDITEDMVDRQSKAKKNTLKNRKCTTLRKDDGIKSTSDGSYTETTSSNSTKQAASKPRSSIESGIGTGTNISTDIAPLSTSSETTEERAKNYKGGKLGRKRKRGYIYDPKPVTEKPPKKFVPTNQKDKGYWDKRQRNNEAARKSREMRRAKEKETYDRLKRLKQENEALRVAITLLIQRNENLEFIIEEIDGKDQVTQPAISVPITTC